MFSFLVNVIAHCPLINQINSTKLSRYLWITIYVKKYYNLLSV